MYKFKQIKNINNSHCKKTNSIDSHIYLSFDIDWCHNSILDFTIDLVESYKAVATWYVTHENPST